ncbi:costars family protein ABRACL [Takifugu rubripes]|nr:costars family protein ABRACL [Takifugu rubripes]
MVPDCVPETRSVNFSEQTLERTTALQEPIQPKIFSFSARMNVSHEIELLMEEIKRLGSKNADGQTCVKFGVLFNDDRCANIFEALVGTLKAAKKRKLISYQGELLLQGVHDNVDITLLQE